MITSYFFANFNVVMLRSNFAHKTLKFDMAATSAITCGVIASSLAARTQSALYSLSTSNASCRSFMAFSSSSAAGNIAGSSITYARCTLIYLCFFFKKLLTISQIFHRRLNFSYMSGLSRCLVSACMQFIVGALDLNLSRLPSAHVLLRGQYGRNSIMDVSAFWCRTAFVMFNAALKFNRFIFFYYTLFMLGPHTHMQSTMSFTTGRMYMPEYALFFLFFTSVSAGEAGSASRLPARRLALL